MAYKITLLNQMLDVKNSDTSADPLKISETER